MRRSTALAPLLIAIGLGGAACAPSGIAEDAALAASGTRGPTGAAVAVAETEAARSLALQVLALEFLLAGLALAGGALSREGLRARIGIGPSRLAAGPTLLLALGTVGLSHGLEGSLQLSGLAERSSLAHLEASLEGIRGSTLWLALIGIGLAPGIAEELLCRGFVQRGLARPLGPGAAIAIASLVFGALHVDPVHGAFAAVLGVYLGCIVQLADSVWPAIACHSANNLLAVLAAAWLAPWDPSHPVGVLLGFGVAGGCLLAVARSAGRSSRAPGVGTGERPPQGPGG